jgi:coenzyme F420-reducing hydrogenase beta subunit
MAIKIGITATNFSGNKGAAAMLQSLLKNITDRREDTTFSLFSVYPKADIAQNPYAFLDIVSTKPQHLIFIAFPLALLYKLLKWIAPVKKLLLKNKILNEFSTCDLVVDAAGISFVDSRGFVMNTYNFICMATPLLVGKKVVKISQAMGPCNKVYNKLWAKMTLSKLQAVCARGKYTYAHLEKLKLKNVTLCADIAFLMQDDENSKSKVMALTASDRFFENKFISLSISSVVYQYCLKENIDYYGVMTQFTQYLNDRGYGVLLIANAARQGVCKLKNNDLPIGDALYSRIQDKSNVRWHGEEFTPETIRELIAKSEILVASRFHAMIGALEKCVPVLLVGWSHKYQEVLDMFGLEEYACDYKTLNFKDLTKMFEAVEKNSDTIKNKISLNLSDVKASSQKNFDIIFEKMDQVMAYKQRYIGNVVASFAGYSNQEVVRNNAASGGVVSETLIHLLETKQIDGALVSKQYVENGEILVKSFVATTKQEILECATSIYVDFNLNKAIKKLDAFNGKVAVVCLPCHLKVIDRLCEQTVYNDKIKYKLCLFCGGVMKDTLVKRVLAKKGIDIQDVRKIYYKKGHWRGNTMIEKADGSMTTISYKYNICTYKNAMYYSADKCFSCSDFFGYSSDMSFGDLWLSEMKQNPIKHTAVIVRNPVCCDIISKMEENQTICINDISFDKIQKGNKRALIYKFKTAQARGKIGEKYGLKIAKTVIDQSKWNHYLAAKIIIKNIIRSKDEKKMDKTFKKNNLLMFFYMAFIRILLSF